MVFAVQSYAPHGGIFVFFAISPVWGYLIAIAAGTVVTALLVVALKLWVGRSRPVDVEAAEPAAVPA